MSILQQIEHIEKVSVALLRKELEKKDRLLEQYDDLIILNPKDDPDPYGIHGIPISHRLRAMGWQ